MTLTQLRQFETRTTYSAVEKQDGATEVVT